MSVPAVSFCNQIKRNGVLGALIHASAWNRISANFAFWGFYEVELPLYGVLGSTHSRGPVQKALTCSLMGIMQPWPNVPAPAAVSTLGYNYPRHHVDEVGYFTRCVASSSPPIM